MIVARRDHGCRVVDIGVARTDARQTLEVALGAVVEAERLQRTGRLHPEAVPTRSEVDGSLVGDDGVRFLRFVKGLPSPEDLCKRSRRRRREALQRALDVGQPHLLQVELRLPECSHVFRKAADGDLFVDSVDFAHAGRKRASQRQQRADLPVVVFFRDGRAGTSLSAQTWIVFDFEERGAGDDHDGRGQHPLRGFRVPASDECRADGRDGGEDACYQRPMAGAGLRFSGYRGGARRLTRKGQRDRRRLRERAQVRDLVLLRHLEDGDVVDAGGEADVERDGVVFQRGDNGLQFPRGAGRRSEARLNLSERVVLAHLRERRRRCELLVNRFRSTAQIRGGSLHGHTLRFRDRPDFRRLRDYGRCC